MESECQRLDEFAILREWPLNLNTTIETQNYIVLFFLDNFFGHECGFELGKEHLTHLRVEWLPPNCTSLVQPVDQGIGNALKIRYRKYLHEHMAKMIFIDKPPMEGVDILLYCAPVLGLVGLGILNTTQFLVVLRKLVSALKEKMK